MVKNHQLRPRLVVIMGAVLILTLIGIWFGLAWPIPTVKAGPTLPSRDRPTPTQPDDNDDDDGSGGSPVGAYIELQVTGAPPGAWAVVQWQDSAGGWHDVAGWQGALSDGDPAQRWWVAAKDFGAGSFRWIVTREAGGSMWGSSTPFNLPNQANQTVRVAISPE